MKDNSVEHQLSLLAKHCCFPCALCRDGKCYEGIDPSQCSLTLVTARELYDAGCRILNDGGDADEE